jgi:hypothetical protein
LHPERVANPQAKRPKAPAKAVDTLVKKAWDQGWWCITAKNSHLKLYSPDGEHIVILPSSPSDHRGIRNAMLLLKKYGLNLKG